MRRLPSAVTAIIAVFPILAGCVGPSPPAGNDLDSYYKSTLAPPRGYARVYVLPPVEDTAFGRIAAVGKLYIGHSMADKALIGQLYKPTFFAFDLVPGNYFIDVCCAETDSAENFSLDPNTTKFLRPVGHPTGAMFGLVGAVIASMANEGKPQFEFLDNASGMREIQSKRLAAISAEAPAYVRQEAVAPGTVTALSAAPQVPGATMVTGDMESELATLKRLYDRRLITKQEYDRKREQLLSAIR